MHKPSQINGLSSHNSPLATSGVKSTPVAGRTRNYLGEHGCYNIVDINNQLSVQRIQNWGGTGTGGLQKLNVH